MFIHYFKIAFRSVFRRRLYSGIHIFGLAISIWCCILLMFYIQNEFAVNTNFEDADRLYRLDSEWRDEGMGLPLAGPAPASKLIAQQFPEIEDFTRMYLAGGIVRSGTEPFHVDLMIADDNIVDMIGLEVMHGDGRTAIAEPNTAVISERLAYQLFNRSDVIDESIEIETWNEGWQVFKITAVIADPPFNSITHLGLNDKPYDVIISPYPFGYFISEVGWTSWESLYIVHYLKLTKNADEHKLQTKLEGFVEAHGPPVLHNNLKFILNPVRTLHLTDSDNGGYRMVIILSIIAISLILITVINSTILMTASSFTKVRDMGVRKVLGGRSSQIAMQFLAEGIIVSVTAAIIGAALAELTVELFFSISGREMLQGIHWNIWSLILLFTATMAFCVVTAIHSWIFSARLNPALAMKNTLHKSTFRNRISEGLIVLQFTIALVFIVSAFTINNQIKHLLTTDLGFDHENVMVFPALPRDWTESGYQQIQTARSFFESHPMVQKATVSWEYPGTGDGPGNSASFRSSLANDPLSMSFLRTDHAYAEAFGLKVISGEFFTDGAPADRIVLNESAAHAFGWTAEEAVGHTVYLNENPLIVEGVLQNFHFHTLRQPIRPIVFLPIEFWQNPAYRIMSLRLEPGNNDRVLESIRSAWHEFFPHTPFEYIFLDDAISNTYKTEERFRRISGFASILAIIIASLGLFGLSAYAAETRTKEIGIRKVLGATITRIITLLNKDFLKLVLIGFIIATPIAWYTMNRWLEEFAYRIDLGAGVFILAGAVAILIAFATVSWQSIKAATMNPVKSLRSE